MISDTDLLAEIGERFTQQLRVTRVKWRPLEVNENYSVVEGMQWTEEDYERQQRDELPIITVNKVSPIVDAISGFEVQNRSEVTYTPRLTTQEAAGFADVVETGAEWIEDSAKSAFYNSQAFKDMLICGVGATDTIVSYDHNPNGAGQVRRIFPGFLMWDPAAREKNFNDAEWCAEARPVHKKTLQKLLKEWGEEEQVYTDSVASSFDDIEFLRYFDVSLQSGELTVIYSYQWREKETIYRVKNPFFGMEQEALYMNYAASASQRFRFDPADGILVLAPKDYNKFKKECSSIGIQLEKQVNQQRYRYYRCMIIGGRIYKKSENYSQTGFSLKFMTGKYSETDQCPYGVVRALKPVQRLYNQAVSDFQGFLRTIPKGGVNIESDAVESIEAFLDTYAKAKEVTIFKPGALSNNKVLPKVAQNMPQGLMEMLPLSGGDMLQVAGVTPDFMGLNDSKELTGKLQAQLVRQALTVLAEFFDAKKFYTIDQGRLFIDMLRILAQNDPGRLVRRVTGEAGAEYIPLLEEGIAAEYDIVIADTPQTPTERQETFEKLVELAGMLAQKGVDIMPLALQYAPLKKDELDKITQAMQPPPPPQPDPLQQGLLEAEINARNASAKKADAEAAKINMEALNQGKELAAQGDHDAAELEKTRIQAQHNSAKLELEAQIKAEELAMQKQQALDEYRLKIDQMREETKLKYAELAVNAMNKRLEIQARSSEQALPPEPEQSDNIDQVLELADAIRQAVEAISQPKRVVVTRNANGLSGEILPGGSS